MRGLITQILLPAFFIIVAMLVALTAPDFGDSPPIILSTAMLSHLNSLYTPVSELNTHKLNSRQVQVDDTLNVNPFQNRIRLTLNDLTGSLCGTSLRSFHFLSTTMTRSVGQNIPQQRRIDVRHRLKYPREHPSTLTSFVEQWSLVKHQSRRIWTSLLSLHKRCSPSRSLRRFFLWSCSRLHSLELPSRSQKWISS